ncbi:MAG: hypothetical protein AAGD07_09685 [Planctomycetota bacterium]
MPARLTAFIAFLAVACVSLTGCGDTTPFAPLSFVAVRGENTGETLVYVTNASETLTLEHCSMRTGEDTPELAMQFAGKMAPGQVAMCGFTNQPAGTKVTFTVPEFGDVTYQLPTVLKTSVDTSDFDWAELPTLTL